MTSMIDKLRIDLRSQSERNQVLNQRNSEMELKIEELNSINKKILRILSDPSIITHPMIDKLKIVLCSQNERSQFVDQKNSVMELKIENLESINKKIRQTNCDPSLMHPVMPLPSVLEKLEKEQKLLDAIENKGTEEAEEEDLYRSKLKLPEGGEQKNDFGTFEGASSLEKTQPDNTAVVSASVSDDFGDFGRAENVDTSKQSIQDEVNRPSDDFGNFKDATNIVQAQPKSAQNEMINSTHKKFETGPAEASNGSDDFINNEATMSSTIPLSTKLGKAVKSLIKAMAAEAPSDNSKAWVKEVLQSVCGGVTSILEQKARLARMRPELRDKIQKWLISFHHLDPRYKILTFFNLVASEGADSLVNEEEEGLLTDEFLDNQPKKLTKVQKMLKDAFTLSSVLTVWRPCSNDAMRKMMEGSGVGKGLDIKGKSSKQGVLSGYVPLLQIHDESHKKLIAKIGRSAKMRVYFKSREARDAVLDQLEPLGNDHMEFDPIKVIPSEMDELDKYARKGYYGIELYQKLFWHGYVVNADISRSGETETGRPSVPGFQDANMKTLKAAHNNKPKPSPMPVVFQYHDTEPMNPLYLVMAYEENGTVVPVVSDFDGFLLGWRREALWFGCNLPQDQEDLMCWCVDRIEELLKKPQTSDSWTMRWLDILKENNPNPDMPQYGFGDPKSYGIMEQAANELIDTGAVRHGCECFNYHFPQEIDGELLIVSDTLKPVPWKYVNVKELQSLLFQMICDGFVFPINPKWILCDPGWKRLYDRLMASDALYSDYTKDVWYPPQSGIREKIDRIAAEHPKGFQQKKKDKKVPESQKTGNSPIPRNFHASMSGNAASELAQLELEKFQKHRKRRESVMMRNSTKLTKEALATFLETFDEDEDFDSDLDSDDLEYHQQEMDNK